MVIDEAAKICEETLLPINQSGDLEGCNFKMEKLLLLKDLKKLIKFLEKMVGKE